MRCPHGDDPGDGAVGCGVPAVAVGLSRADGFGLRYLETSGAGPLACLQYRRRRSGRVERAASQYRTSSGWSTNSCNPTPGSGQTSTHKKPGPTRSDPSRGLPGTAAVKGTQLSDTEAASLTCRCPVDFAFATFIGPAYFRSATFTAHADFGLATFTQGVPSEVAQFCRPATGRRRTGGVAYSTVMRSGRVMLDARTRRCRRERQPDREADPVVAWWARLQRPPRGVVLPAEGRRGLPEGVTILSVLRSRIG